jgi:23S rRNA (guanine745-N1)-methyltransferase
VTAATLICPVRGCGEPLRGEPAALRCPRGHLFDRARSGYVNLLQPQERRARYPGDTRAAALARRRLFEAGVFDELLAALERELAALSLPAGPAVLDAGCGEGSVLRALAAVRPGEAPGISAHGVDISTPAIDLAARAFPEATWIVANADRRLPWADGSFDAILSITARRNPPELRRLLAPGGRVLVAVPAQDDLAELREAVLGESLSRERLDRALVELAPHFELERRSTVRQVARLGPALLQDLLTATYRGARHAERERAAVLAEMEVTLGHDLAVLRARG